MKASPGSWASERSAGSGWGLHPIGAIFSSCFIEHISGGGTFVDKTMYCAESSDLIASVIIYLCGFVLFFRRAMTGWLDRVIEKREAAMLLSKEGEMTLPIQCMPMFASVLMLVALGGCFSERSGVINIGLKCIMVFGALVRCA